MKVTEGVSGVWHYHLSNEADPFKSLCGRPVMACSIRLEDWDKPFGDHLPRNPSFCAKCTELSTRVKH